MAAQTTSSISRERRFGGSWPASRPARIPSPPSSRKSQEKKVAEISKTPKVMESRIPFLMTKLILRLAKVKKMSRWLTRGVWRRNEEHSKN